MRDIGTQSDLGQTLERGTEALRDRLFVGRRRVWITAVLVTLLTWQVSFAIPKEGVDQSWIAGLYMAVHSGKDFGNEIVFTYGPLGFLDWPALWVSWLGVIAFVFSSLIFFGFIALLIGALERSTNLLSAALVAFLFAITLPDLEQVPLLLAVGFCFFALREDPPEWGLGLLALGGGALSAFECLIKLSSGPAIFVVCALGMIGARAGRRHWAWFAASSVGGLIILWLLAGQSLGSLWDYAHNGWQVVSGYNEAMAIGGGATWAAVAIVLAALAVVAATALAPFRDRRAHGFAIALVVVAAFTVYKYGIIRFETGHIGLALWGLLGIWLLVPWRRGAQVRFLVASAIGGVIFVHAYPATPRYDLLGNLKSFKDGAELAVRPGLRDGRAAEARAEMQSSYDLGPKTVAALQGNSVAIEPWEIAIAWAYELDWAPLPVFQNYSAYTPTLDRLNADALRDPDGPQVILRQNPGNSAPWGARQMDGRLPAWDPPEQAVATLCNFVPISVVPSWQVLGRVPDRCGKERLAATVDGEPGEEISVPQAGPGEVVVLKLKGLGIEGTERLKSILWKPPHRYADLDSGLATYRVVPATAGDGLVVSRDPRLDGTLGFEELPQLDHLRIEEVDRGLEFSFYRMKVRLDRGHSVRSQASG